MRSTRKGVILAISLGLCALLGGGCDEAALGDAGPEEMDAGVSDGGSPPGSDGGPETDGGDPEPDAGLPTPDAGPDGGPPPGCTTGTFDTSTFGSACFGD